MSTLRGSRVRSHVQWISSAHLAGRKGQLGGRQDRVAEVNRRSIRRACRSKHVGSQLGAIDRLELDRERTLGPCPSPSRQSGTIVRYLDCQGMECEEYLMNWARPAAVTLVRCRSSNSSSARPRDVLSSPESTTTEARNLSLMALLLLTSKLCQPPRHDKPRYVKRDWEGRVSVESCTDPKLWTSVRDYAAAFPVGVRAAAHTQHPELTVTTNLRRESERDWWHTAVEGIGSGGPGRRW